VRLRDRAATDRLVRRILDLWCALPFRPVTTILTRSARRVAAMRRYFERSDHVQSNGCGHRVAGMIQRGELAGISVRCIIMGNCAATALIINTFEQHPIRVIRRPSGYVFSALAVGAPPPFRQKRTSGVTGVAERAAARRSMNAVRMTPISHRCNRRRGSR
jgi:hypothetical protein